MTRAGDVTSDPVFSHFILDLASHAPDMPLIPKGSAKDGLGLWRYLSIDRV